MKAVRSSRMIQDGSGDGPEPPPSETEVEPKTRSVDEINGNFVITVIFYLIPGSILVVVSACLFVALIVGMIAANGAAAIVIGNGLLDAARQPGYTSHVTAAIIGAIGAVISSVIVATVLACCSSCLPVETVIVNDEPVVDYPWYIKFICSMLVYTLGGVLGCAIISHFPSLHGMDVVHGATAGALGGGMLSIALLLLWRIVYAMTYTVSYCIGFVLGIGLTLLSHGHNLWS